MDKICKVAFCPHYGNRAPQTLIHTQKYMERAWSSHDGSETEQPWSSFVVECGTCKHLLIYDNLGDQYEDNNFDRCELAYPNDPGLHISVGFRDVHKKLNNLKDMQ